MGNTSKATALPASSAQGGARGSAAWARISHEAERQCQSASEWLDRHWFFQGIFVFAVTALGLAIWRKLFDHIIPKSGVWAIYWPFNGIVIAIMVIVRRRQWPWIIAAFLCIFTDTVLARRNPVNEAILAFCNIAEILLAAYALPRFRSLRQWMMESHLASRFTAFAVVIGPALAGLLFAHYFSQTYGIGFWHIYLRWALPDALGAALWTPLILVLCSREVYDLFRLRALPETIGLLGGLGIVSWLTFHQDRYPLGFLPYPFLLMVALRLGFSGAVIGANMLTLIAGSLSLRGTGPFVSASGVWTDEQTIVLQLFSTLAVLFVFPLSVRLVERRNFEEKLQEAYADMERLATIDKLTSVANRRRFDQVLEVEWKRAIRSTTSISLLMVDADCFKAYNDRYGHLAGDDCLRQIAAALSSEQLRPHDLVARYGGEEFAVLLPGATGASVAELAERMREAVSAAGLRHEGNPHGRVTVSIGFASIVPALGMLPEALISAADGALYAAKQNGRNRAQRCSAATADDLNFEIAAAS